MFTEVFCIIEGRVQRVGYRAFVEEVARGFDVTGYVKNLENGNVEVLAQGIPDDLKDFVETLNEGSVLSRVESVGVDWRSVSNQYDDFKVLVS